MKQVYEFKIKENLGEGDLVGAGFSWPPRCYSCSFCKREFRSAQALGGHMNVHRRDRARLRQLSPPRAHTINNNSNYKLNLNLDPNPSSINSNPISPPPPPLSSLLTKFPKFTSPLPPLSSDSVPVRPIITKDFIKTNKGSIGLFGGERVISSQHEKAEVVGLDLEIGLFSTQSKEEVLDLELRLGYT